MRFTGVEESVRRKRNLILFELSKTEKERERVAETEKKREKDKTEKKR